jgi:hypothetical protein
MSPYLRFFYWYSETAAKSGTRFGTFVIKEIYFAKYFPLITQISADNLLISSAKIREIGGNFIPHSA